MKGPDTQIAAVISDPEAATSDVLENGDFMVSEPAAQEDLRGA